MKAHSRLVLTDEIHTSLREHLFPGDGKEAAAILICTRSPGSNLKLLSQELILVPHKECSVRTPDSLTWPGKYLEDAIDRALVGARSIILVHSHPGGLYEFSWVDDASDAGTMVSLAQGVESIHGSAIMVPCGAMRARIYHPDQTCEDIELVTVPGDTILFWSIDAEEHLTPPMAFTSQMPHALQRLTVAVIGVSGTGSIVAEQVTRLGFGKVILVDHDHVEEKNLNRILNSTIADAQSKRPKVEMFAEAIERIRGPNVAEPINNSVLSREAVLAVANADVIFCCVDTHQGRMICDLMASSFLTPLFDVGVKIPTRPTESDGRAIHDVQGRIDYVKPGGATLADRKIYTPDSLYAEALRSTNPDAHRDQMEHGYISGVQEEAPSVITLNMRAASACVNEFIARAFPFREEHNSKYAQTNFTLSGCLEDFEHEDSFRKAPNPKLAQGGKEPLLGLPDLGVRP